MRENYLLGTYSRKQFVQMKDYCRRNTIVQRFICFLLILIGHWWVPKVIYLVYNLPAPALNYASKLHSISSNPCRKIISNIIILIPKCPTIQNPVDHNPLKWSKSQYALNPSFSCNHYKKLTLDKKWMKDEQSQILSEYP